MQEVDHALALNKRVVPLSLRAVSDSEVPEGIRVRNWIPIGDAEFERCVERLVTGCWDGPRMGASAQSAYGQGERMGAVGSGPKFPVARVGASGCGAVAGRGG